MHTRLTQLIALAGIVVLSAQPASSAPFPHTPEQRPVPAIGTSEADVLANFGRPTEGLVTQAIGGAQTSVWDFGTFRVFLRDGRVVESRRW
ncbi:MAG: hypothetical protein AAF499_01680 [Pseudomonadota bacterium]